MFLVLRRVVFGQSWKPETTLTAHGPKSYKKLEKGRKNEGPRPLFGALWGSDWPPREGLNRLGDGLDVAPGSVSSIFMFFF